LGILLFAELLQCIQVPISHTPSRVMSFKLEWIQGHI
jgi:hypothetical protein